LVLALGPFREVRPPSGRLAAGPAVFLVVLMMLVTQ
jgi:hypothetical protein